MTGVERAAASQAYQSTAEFYDYIEAYTTRRDRAFFVEQALDARGPVLELGCGTGRILIPTAEALVGQGREHGVTGLDSSHAMMDICRKKVTQLPRSVQQRIRLIPGYMTNFDLGQSFSLITTPFRGFQHLLSVKEQLNCLECARRHLAEDGRFILDVFQTDPRGMFDPQWTRETQDTPETELPEGRRFTRSYRIVRFHRAEQCNDVEMYYDVRYPDGRMERLTQQFRMRYFFRYEVEHLLARCGMRVVELYGDYDRSALEDQSPEMVFIAAKARV